MAVMNTPEVIAKLYKDLTRVPATTIVIPRIENVLRRYSEHPNIYYSESLGFKIYCPAGWIVDPGAGRTGSQFDYLVAISGFIIIQSERGSLFQPEICFVVESVGDIHFMGYFHMRLNALCKAGIEVAYHLDELFQVVTLKLKQTSSDGLLDFQIQKYFIRDGRVYNIIVRGLDPGQMENEPELVEEIRQIVRSFAFVTKGSGQKNRLRLITNTEKALPGG
ncbi:MAG: hypothetical protein ABSA82_10985 [Thermacetogeniaceae bacterium]|jgi:hypothetical protein